MRVQVKSYPTPSLVLLAFDWPAADQYSDFAGYGIERTPGLDGEKSSMLPVRRSYWWDAAIGSSDRGTSIRYRVVPMVGAAEAYQCLDEAAGQIEVRVP
jgi:hypothetical protein